MKKIYNFSAKTQPLPHQIDAIDFVQNNNIVPLFDDQGLGKSKIVIDAMCYGLENGTFESVLVVCRKTLLNTWSREIKKHSHLDFTVLDGARKQRGRSLMHLTKFYLIGYESLIQELERIKLLLDLRKFAIVLDESQKIKNPRSKITQALFEINGLANKKIIISGSALANKPEDLWSQFYFLDNGQILGNDYSIFKGQFAVKLKESKSLEKYSQSLAVLREKVSRVSMRRTKDILELPEKIYYDVYVELENRQKEIYKKALKELVIEIKNTDGSVIVRQIDNYLVKLLRLIQIASNPRLIDETYMECPIKFKKIDSVVKDIIARKCATSARSGHNRLFLGL